MNNITHSTLRKKLRSGLVPFAVLLAACGDNSDAGMPAIAPVASAPAQSAAFVGERIRLMISGSLNGRLEPCGCASGQAGGLARRMQMVLQSHVHDLFIEGGDLVLTSTRPDLEKAMTAAQVLFTMPKAYDALGVGPHDLLLPFGEWNEFLSVMRVPVVASDLEGDARTWPAVPFLEREIRGTKVRIASFTMSLPNAITATSPQPLQLLTPNAAWARALTGATLATRCILLVHADPDTARKLAASLQPPPDLIIGIDSTNHEPPSTAEQAGKVPLVFPGIRGRYLLDVTIARTADSSRVTSYDPMLLQGSETKPDAGQDPATRLIIRQHREQVAQDNVLEQMADTSKPQGASFVGSAACAACHQKDYEAWQNSKHAHAWDTLIRGEQDQKRYGWPVTKYPDCVSCHTTGYGQPGGFITAEKTPLLINVGCERCHGAGSEHTASSGTVKLGKVGDGLPATTCTQCHDFEQSPKFDYTPLWRVIQHGAKAQLPKGK